MIKIGKRDKSKALNQKDSKGVSLTAKSLFLASFLFLFIFISSSFVLAVPPQSVSTTSLDLVSTFPTSHKIGQNYSLKVHVFNTATEELLTSGINCYYHFYTHQVSGNSHVSKGEMVLDGVDYEATVDGDLINLSGEYSILEWCNSSTEIGYNKYTFEVTDSGSSQENEIINENQQGLILVALTLIAIILFLTYLYNRGEYYLPMISGILFLLSGIMAFSSLEPIVGTTMKDVIGVVLLGLGLLSLAEVIWRYFPDDNGY